MHVAAVERDDSSKRIQLYGLGLRVRVWDLVSGSGSVRTAAKGILVCAWRAREAIDVLVSILWCPNRRTNRCVRMRAHACVLGEK